MRKETLMGLLVGLMLVLPECQRSAGVGWAAMFKADPYRVDMFGGIGVLISGSHRRIESSSDQVFCDGYPLPLEGGLGCWLVGGGKGEVLLLKRITGGELKKAHEYYLEGRDKPLFLSTRKVLEILGISGEEFDKACKMPGLRANEAGKRTLGRQEPDD